MVLLTKLSRLALCGLAALTLGVAGCPESHQTAATPASSVAAADLLPAPGDAAAAPAPVDSVPRSLELGLLRQSAPTLPAPGSVYAVAELPLHTPPLQDGTEDDRRLVELYCVGCHSTTYISMQPPLPRERWEAEVKKMITAYGAVVPEPIAVRIATYLHAYYGNSPLPPRKRPLPTKTPAVSDGSTRNGRDP